MQIEVTDIEVLENLDWRSTTQTLANGGIRKGEIICAIRGESAERLVKALTERVTVPRKLPDFAGEFAEAASKAGMI